MQCASVNYIPKLDILCSNGLNKAVPPTKETMCKQVCQAIDY